MKVFNQDLLTQSITFVPRFEPLGDINIYVYNSFSDTTQEILQGVNYTYLGGEVLLEDLDITDLKEGNKYTLTIKDNDVIIYRGLAMSTNQEPQEYKDTKNAYIYE